MKKTIYLLSALLLLALTGCEPNPPIKEWDVTYTDGSNITISTKSAYAAINYQSADELYGISPKLLEAVWRGELIVEPSDDPENPTQMTYMFSVQSDNADTSIEVNGQIIGSWVSGDHSINYTFPEGTHQVVVKHKNHSDQAKFNLSMGIPYFLKDMAYLNDSTTRYRNPGTTDKPFDVYYVSASSSENLDNTATISLAGLDADRDVVLLLSSEDAINWNIIDKDPALRLNTWMNSARSESSLYGKDVTSAPWVIEDMPHVTTSASDANAFINPVFSKNVVKALIKDRVAAVSLVDPLAEIPEDAIARPFYGQWDYFNSSKNRTIRTQVLVQNGSLVMDEGIEIDATGRIVNGGTLRNAAYTQNYFANIQLQQSSQKALSIATAAETGAKFTVGNITYTRSTPDTLLCGGSQPFYGVRNLLLSSPETQEGALLDDCAQRAYEILKRESRSGGNLWIHRFPLYLVYLADYALSIDDHDNFGKYTDLARELISGLSHDPDLENSNNPDFYSYRNIALAFADIDLVTNASVSIDRGRYARQVMAIGEELNERVVSTDYTETLKNIQAIYQDAQYLSTSGAITEVTSAANKIKAFVVKADQKAVRYLTTDSATPGANLIEALKIGDDALANLKTRAYFDVLTEEPGQTYGEFFFIINANSNQEYIKSHPEFSFFGMNVHHAIEKDQDWTRYLGYEKLQSAPNLRGIAADISDRLHQGKIRTCWNQLYNKYPNRNNIPEAKLIERAKYIDDLYGHLFVPAIRPIPPQGADYMPDCVPPQ